MNAFFRKFAQKTSEFVGRPLAFFLALILVIGWAIVGPLFDYSDSWQLVINTGTTILTFLMVFLIQNTQNRDAKAIHLKLDEVIRSNKHARNSMVDIEDKSDGDLMQLQEEYTHLRERAEGALEQRRLKREANKERRAKEAALVSEDQPSLSA
ncbi:MAG: low affinity iron permease family protein [Candidatus Moraniibacteriota bacterium]